MKKSKPIRTLKDAERWCKDHKGILTFFPSFYGLPTWKASNGTGVLGTARTPWGAVEKLRKAVEK